eukprot:UN12077
MFDKKTRPSEGYLLSRGVLIYPWVFITRPLV